MFRLALLLLPCIAGCTTDRDGDGYEEEVDCDDTNAAVNPGATEVRGNAWDDDCDGDIAAWLWVGTYTADTQLDGPYIVATLDVEALGGASFEAALTGPDNETITWEGSGSAGPLDDEQTFAFGMELVARDGVQTFTVESSGTCELQEPALDCTVTWHFPNDVVLLIPFARQ